MKAFIIVDVENDFLPGGALGVKGGDEVVPIINKLMPHFPLVVATKDWHPPNHCSFAETHPGRKVGDRVTLKGTQQILWPIHCVKDTWGAEFAPTLDKERIEATFYKGTDPEIDSYSAFFDNSRHQSTGLADFLQSRHIKEIYLAGLTTEYCVLYSALDALDLGFSVTVFKDACRGINLSPHDGENAWALMAQKGAKIVHSNNFLTSSS